jgi:hypothetical protein
VRATVGIYKTPVIDRRRYIVVSKNRGYRLACRRGRKYVIGKGEREEKGDEWDVINWPPLRWNESQKMAVT